MSKVYWSRPFASAEIIIMIWYSNYMHQLSKQVTISKELFSNIYVYQKCHTFYNQLTLLYLKCLQVIIIYYYNIISIVN